MCKSQNGKLNDDDDDFDDNDDDNSNLESDNY